MEWSAESEFEQSMVSKCCSIRPICDNIIAMVGGVSEENT
jgi:hypothetical protein